MVSELTNQVPFVPRLKVSGDEKNRSLSKHARVRVRLRTSPTPIVKMAEQGESSIRVGTRVVVKDKGMTGFVR